MGFRDLFFNDEGQTFSRRKRTEIEPMSGLYSDMLGLNKHFAFVLTNNKAKDKAEFEDICKAAIDILKQDLRRMGESFCQIEPALRNKLRGAIGSMTILADNDGNVASSFHRREDDGYWDGISKKYPEKETVGKWKFEVFFALEDDDED